MSENIKCNLEQLHPLIRARIQRLKRYLLHSLKETAVDCESVIRKRTPKAFGELRESIHAVTDENPKVVVDAPHAAAVERGSAPHTPDLQKLIAWVKLRGMQGLNGPRQRWSGSSMKAVDVHKALARENSRLGPTTRGQIATVREMLDNRVRVGRGGRFTPVDAAEQVAKAIARDIEANGTKPHWFVMDSLPEAGRILARNVRRALRER